MSYHASPYDSIANTIAHTRFIIEQRQKRKALGVKRLKKRPFTQQEVEHLDAICKFNDERGIGPKHFKRSRAQGKLRQLLALDAARPVGKTGYGSGSGTGRTTRAKSVVVSLAKITLPAEIE